MEMTKEALALLQETAVKAAAANRLDLPGDGRKAYLNLGGKVKEIDIPPKVREHQFRRLDDLIDMANLYAENDGRPVVWHDQNGVILVLDDADRRDRGTFPLEITPQLQTLMMLEKQQPQMTQKELIRLLRTQLNLDSAAIAVFRRIDWSTSTAGSGTVERGRESLGRSIEQQVKGAGDPRIDQHPDSAVPQRGRG